MVGNLLQKAKGRILQDEYGSTFLLHLDLLATCVALFGNKLRALSRSNLQ
ncbi:MAG: hypothetical protein N6V49_05810 [Serratia symbiotica]|nr:hypothetical protein [Serratia symbiotica]